MVTRRALRPIESVRRQRWADRFVWLLWESFHRQSPQQMSGAGQRPSSDQSPCHVRHHNWANCTPEVWKGCLAGPSCQVQFAVKMFFLPIVVWNATISSRTTRQKRGRAAVVKSKHWHAPELRCPQGLSCLREEEEEAVSFFGWNEGRGRQKSLACKYRAGPDR